MASRVSIRPLALASTSLACVVAMSCGGVVKESAESGGDSGGSSSGVVTSSGGTTGSGSGAGSGSGSSGGGSSSSDDASADATSSPPGSDGGGFDVVSQDVAIDAPSAPAGLAGVALVVNGDLLTPSSCPSDDWEFPLPSGEGMPNGFCKPVVGSAYLINTGTLPMPYLAQGLWDYGTHYEPGVATGGNCQQVGVLAPGAKVDITSVYQGGVVALLGSAEPFSSPDAGKFVSDEGTIPWPAGVVGSGGAGTMYVAQIDVPYNPQACTAVATWW